MTLHFREGQDAYEISIARRGLSLASGLFNLDRKVLVVTGEGVPQAYARAILGQCSEGFLLSLPDGEDHKTLASVELILEALLDHGFTRSDAIVAVGGGVVGDTAGFAAACYMRGIDWYNVPTTLLSQADSSVGGKTGVNFHGIKNLVGAFKQPAGVLIDPDTLDTLSPRLFAEGFAEIVKMAATGDASLFRLLESTADPRPLMEEILAAALSIKIAVVEADPRESGLRAVLNFGHTIGHAVEGAGQGKYYHGEAVAIGMLYMSCGEAAGRIEDLLKKYGLPTEDPFSADELMAFAAHDKKNRGGRIKLVKVKEIGSFTFEEAGPEELKSIIQARKI